MGVETGFLAAAQVVRLPEAAEGDALHVHALPQVAHDVVAGAVGQADVGDEQVEVLFASKLKGLGDGAGGGDGEAEAAEQPGHHTSCVLVVFDEKDTSAERTARRGGAISN